MSVMINKAIDCVLTRREAAVKSLLKSLEHLPQEQQFSVLCSWVPLSELEALAEFQKRGKI
jgi:hypothetical protein